MAASFRAVTRSSSTTKAFSCYISRAFCSASTSNSETTASGTVFPTGSSVRWIFLGCPGVGKGTYSSRLSNLLGVPHIATGDLVRLVLHSSGPRASQEILEGVTNIDLVINLKLREEALIAKCLGRRICSKCGENYNIACINMKGENGKPGICMAPLSPPPNCASKLIQWSDDTEEVVK